PLPELSPASRRAVTIGGLMLLALASRLAFFTGLSLGDDVFYALQATSHAFNHMWPPEPYHWQTRLGVTGPTALALLAFGKHPLTFVLWPLLASTLTVLVCYVIARQFVGERVALLAAAFQA